MRRIRSCSLLGADIEHANADRIVFTSGGTEANNLALFGTPAVPTGANAGLVARTSQHTRSSAAAAARRLANRLDQGPGMRHDRPGTRPRVARNARPAPLPGQRDVGQPRNGGPAAGASKWLRCVSHEEFLFTRMPCRRLGKLPGPLFGAGRHLDDGCRAQVPWTLRDRRAVGPRAHRAAADSVRRSATVGNAAGDGIGCAWSWGCSTALRLSHQQQAERTRHLAECRDALQRRLCEVSRASRDQRNGGASAPHAQRVLPGGGSASPTDGIGSGGRLLFQRVGLCQRVERTVARACRRWGCRWPASRVPLRLSVGVTTEFAELARGGRSYPQSCQPVANWNFPLKFARIGSYRAGRNRYNLVVWTGPAQPIPSGRRGD